MQFVRKDRAPLFGGLRAANSQNLESERRFLGNTWETKQWKNMSLDCIAIDNRKSRARSKVTNGSAFLPSGDNRSTWARLARDTFAALVSHCGGADTLSETRRMAARRCASLEAELVHFEDSFAQARAAGHVPEPAQLDLYSRLSNTQRRLAESLGWDRTARDVSPDLNAIIASHASGGAS